MGKAVAKKQDDVTRQMHAAIKVAFPTVSDRPEEVVYRYNPVAIRVRVISPRFDEKPTSRRELMVRKALVGIPRDDLADITMMVMLTPEEAALGDDFMNLEFDDPTGRFL